MAQLILAEHPVRVAQVVVARVEMVVQMVLPELQIQAVAVVAQTITLHLLLTHQAQAAAA